MGSFFSKPKTFNAAAEVKKQEAEAEAVKNKRAAELQSGRVDTILTSGQGLTEAESVVKKKKTILGG